MNDAPSSSDHPELEINAQDGIGSSSAPSDDADIKQQKRQAHKEQKLAFLAHLIRNVDIVIYAQLSVLYYMDCNFPKFLLRGLPHWAFFTPKPSFIPPIPVTPRAYIFVIFIPNILFNLLHLLRAPPTAGEATRGYLHGGLLTDFVGQKSPVGRWRLVALDLLVLILQILMLGVTLEKRALETGGVDVSGAGLEVRQDYDSEERGMLRQDLEEAEDIEMRDLRHTDSGRTGGDEDRERDELLAANTGSGRVEQHPLDSLYTGEHVVANLHVLEMVRRQWQSGGVGAGPSGASAASGVQAAAVAAAAGRTLTYRLGEGIARNS